MLRGKKHGILSASSDQLNDAIFKLPTVIKNK